MHRASDGDCDCPLCVKYRAWTPTDAEWMAHACAELMNAGGGIAFNHKRAVAVTHWTDEGADYMREIGANFALLEYDGPYPIQAFMIIDVPDDVNALMRWFAYTMQFTSTEPGG